MYFFCVAIVLFFAFIVYRHRRIKNYYISVRSRNIRGQILKLSRPFLHVLTPDFLAKLFPPNFGVCIIKRTQIPMMCKTSKRSADKAWKSRAERKKEKTPAKIGL